MDHKLIGLLVARLVEPRMSWDELAHAARVHRSTMYRLRDGDPRVTQRTMRRVESALSLPFDTLTAVGVHDWATLTRENAIDKGMVQWLQGKAGESWSARDAPST